VAGLVERFGLDAQHGAKEAPVLEARHGIGQVDTAHDALSVLDVFGVRGSLVAAELHGPGRHER
jgi:hypothetical protein